MAGTCECGNEPSGSIKCVGYFLTSCKPVGLSGRTVFGGVWVAADEQSANKRQ